MASEQAREYRAFFSRATRTLATAGGPEALRRAFEPFGQQAAALDPGTRVNPADAGGVPSLWVIPADAGDEMVVWLHGGGYVMGSPTTHAPVAGHLAHRMKARALVVGYSLAPESPHPGPVQDCLRAYRWLVESGVEPAKVAFVGDSAGGALVITTQLLAHRCGLPLPAASVCLSPWLDVDPAGDRSSTFARFFLRPEQDSRDVLVNPLTADLSGFGPLFVQVGGDEAEGGFVAAAQSLVGVARSAGVAAQECDVIPEMVHMFQLCAGRMPEADAALDRIAAFLLGAIKTPSTVCARRPNSSSTRTRARDLGSSSVGGAE